MAKVELHNVYPILVSFPFNPIYWVARMVSTLHIVNVGLGVAKLHRNKSSYSLLYVQDFAEVPYPPLNNAEVLSGL